jgi:hypothetical protein
MSDFVFDVARGREVEIYGRVDTNDPTNSAFKVVVLALVGLETDDTLRTHADLAVLLAATNNEVTNANYARKTLTDADLAAYTVDTTAHLITLPLPSQVYTAVGVGDTWAKALLTYDSDTTSGTDANIIPVTAQDIRLYSAPLVPNGGDVTFSWPNGLLVA